MPVIKDVIKMNIENKIKSEYLKDCENPEDMDAFINAIAIAVSDAIATTLTTDAMVIGACPPMGGPLTGGKIV